MLGILAILCSSLALSILGVIVRLLPGVSVEWFNLLRFGFGGMLVVVYAASTGTSLRGDDHPLLIVRGIAGGLGSLLLFSSVRIGTPVAVATLLLYTFPLFAVVMAWPMLHEKLQRWEWLPFALALIGVYLVLDFRGASSGPVSGQLQALGSGLLTALTTVLVRKLRARETSWVIYFYFCLAGTLISIPALWQGEPLLTGLRDCVLLALFVLAGFAGQMLWHFGLKFVRAITAGIFAMVEVAFASLWGAIILDERLSVNFYIGASLLALSVALLSLDLTLLSSLRRRTVR